MRRFTIHLRFGDNFLPMVTCEDLKQVALYISGDESGPGFKVFDNIEGKWVPPEVVFLACISSGNYEEATT